MSVDSLASVKARFSAVVDDVRRTHERVTVTHHGVPAAVIVSPDDLASMEETIALLSDSRERDDVEVGMADVAEGRVADLDDVLSEMRSSGRL